LIAASLVIVIGVSALIGFRGFSTAREVPVQHRVILQAPATDVETGAAASAAVVIGGARPRSAARSASRRTKKSAPARSGLSAPAPAAAAPAEPAAPATSEPLTPLTDAPPAPEPQPAAPAPAADPVGEVLEQVDKTLDEVPPVESVGDVLLDLRDALP
jgi:hypothetical protein